ncbi:MAG: SDR family oxidoreductase, partial [Desulfuromonadaceae bacterium]
CSPEELKPQSPYAESKLSAERMLEEMHRNQGLRFVTCRFGTIFGVSPGMRFHTAINKFCWQAVMGEPITVWRTALNQFRPYLDIVDAVNALTMIIRMNLYDCRVYNVVTINTSVQSIIDVISGFVPDVSVKFVDTQIMNQLSYHVSNQRFLETGYEYRGDLVSGIKDTIELLKGSRSWRQS